MTRRVRLVVPIVLVFGAGLGLSLHAVRRPHRVDDETAPRGSPGAAPPLPIAQSPTVGQRAAAAPRTGVDAVRPASTRSRRGIGVNEAIRELDLIRPSRDKLAEDFTVRTTDGKTFRLRDHRGEIVFLNFWATWCAPCKEEMPAMERLYRELRDRGLVVVAVSVDADPAVVPPFLREHRVSFSVGVDPTMEVAALYGVRALPVSFLVDRDGRMTAFALGPRAWDDPAAHSLIEGLAR